MCFLDSKWCGWTGFALLKEQRGYIKSTSDIFFKLFISTAQTWVRLFNSHYWMRICPKNVCLQQVEWNHQTRFLFSVENWIEREGSAWSLKLKCVICQCYNTFSYPSLIRRVDNASCSLYCKYCGSAMLSKYCSVYSSLTTMPRQKHYQTICLYNWKQMGRVFRKPAWKLLLFIITNPFGDIRGTKTFQLEKS